MQSRSPWRELQGLPRVEEVCLKRYGSKSDLENEPKQQRVSPTTVLPQPRAVSPVRKEHKRRLRMHDALGALITHCDDVQEQQHGLSHHLEQTHGQYDQRVLYAEVDEHCERFDTDTLHELLDSTLQCDEDVDDLYEDAVRQLDQEEEQPKTVDATVSTDMMEKDVSQSRIRWRVWDNNDFQAAILSNYGACMTSDKSPVEYRTSISSDVTPFSDVMWLKSTTWSPSKMPDVDFVFHDKLKQLLACKACLQPLQVGCLPLEPFPLAARNAKSLKEQMAKGGRHQ